ncbi:membrane or secreted protein [Candidatus Magnetobacterium bavaricum]|uniref:Membrane or secreted protein n=1 Tax=Candidatus Magnetobacterium bavaricum TaxID=29290 RepID=A0A0F3GNG5_9BACT|nr:membrane or secreted protein [Candidatus Magnetobacterium bavaricum]
MKEKLMKRLFVRSVIIMATMVMLFGCAHTMKQTDQLVGLDAAGGKFGMGKFDMPILSTTANARNIYFMKQKEDGTGGMNPYIYCAEPSPDVALNTLTSWMMSVGAELPNGTKVDFKASDNTTATVVELAGRNALNVLARDLLYRSCELMVNSINVATDDNETTCVTSTTCVTDTKCTTKTTCTKTNKCDTCTKREGKIATAIAKAHDSYDRVADIVERLYEASFLKSGGSAEQLIRIKEADATNTKRSKLDKNANCIREWLYNGSMVNTDSDRLEKYKQWLTKLPADPIDFLYSPIYDEQRIKAIKELKIPCQ